MKWMAVWERVGVGFFWFLGVVFFFFVERDNGRNKEKREPGEKSV